MVLMSLIPRDYLLRLQRPQADYLVDCLYGECIVLADVYECGCAAPLLPCLTLVYDSLNDDLFKEVIDNIAIIRGYQTMGSMASLEMSYGFDGSKPSAYLV